MNSMRLKGVRICAEVTINSIVILRYRIDTYIDVFGHVVVVHSSVTVRLDRVPHRKNAVSAQQLEMCLQIVFRRVVRLVHNVLCWFRVILVNVGVSWVNRLKAKVVYTAKKECVN